MFSSLAVAPALLLCLTVCASGVSATCPDVVVLTTDKLRDEIRSQIHESFAKVQ